MRIIKKQLKLGCAVGQSIGKIRTKRAGEIVCSPVGIGLEKADGDFYEPSAAYPYLGELGVKWVRVQSGWARCEKQRGVYDFAWLDDMVEGISAQGAQPWICLCYGNPVYDARAPRGSRAVGFPPIFSETAMQAWLEYTEKVVSRYRGKVGLYEVWNEPDGTHCWKSGVNGKEYGLFVRKTAEVIKSADKTGKVAAGSMCNIVRTGEFCRDAGIRFDGDAAVAGFFEDWLSAGAAHAVDYVTVHLYQGEPESKASEFFRYIRKTLDKYNKKIGIIQGETGAPAAFGRAGALNSAEWTERKQAKYLLRRLYTDIVHGVAFTSYFSCLDMYENMNNDRVRLTRDRFGFYGVLAAEFGQRGQFMGKYRKRPSFYALQALCTVFADGVKKVKRGFEFVTLRNSYWGGSDVSVYDPLKKQLIGHSFQSATGNRFDIFYMASSVLNIEYNGTVSLSVKRKLERPAVIDLFSGEIFPVREENIGSGNVADVTELYRIPLKDYPCLLIDLADTHLKTCGV